MVESEKNDKIEPKKWNFKPMYARDVLNKAEKITSAMRLQAKTAADAAGLSWKQVLNMRYGEFLNFISEFSKSEGMDEFGEFDFLGKE